ncbi:MAG: spore germination protein GerW family protein [Anaerolineae bacterium]
MDELKTLLEKIGSIGDEINVDAVFGKPETVGDRVLIPVAEIAYGFGAGLGMGGQGECCCAESGDKEACCCADKDEAGACCEHDESCECECHAEGAGGGGGGGGGGVARPIAYIEVGPDGAKVEPIMDEQKIAFAGMLLGAWAIAWVGMVLVTLFRAIAGRE